MEWYQDGSLHREDDRPAQITHDHVAWYKNGQLHRPTGPAIMYYNGKTEYWVKGKPIEPVATAPPPADTAAPVRDTAAPVRDTAELDDAIYIIRGVGKPCVYENGKITF